MNVAESIVILMWMHFVDVDEKDIDVRNQLKEMKPETREIYALIIDSHDGSVPN